MEENIQKFIEKFDHDLTYLLKCFREVLEEVGEAGLVRRLPLLGESTPDAADPLSKRKIQAYSILFQLMNMVEENTATQFRRDMERVHGLQYEEGLLGNYLKRLRNLGYTQNQIFQALPEIHIEPVLTAHPTEAKRTTVLEHHRELYLLLVKLENQMWTPIERKHIRKEIKSLLERLWRTGEIFLEKPDVSSELRGVMHYLRNIFTEVLAIIDRRIRESWEEAGFNPRMLTDPERLPRLTFGNWVGGDRDGHPLVTAGVTQRTLAELRCNAMMILHEKISAMASQLSLSDSLQHPPKFLLEHIQKLVDKLGERAEPAIHRNAHESWRQLLNLMLARLPLDHQGETLIISEFPGCYRFASELEEDMRVLRNALFEVGAVRLANGDALKVLRLLQNFGFHLAALDIRQNSKFHDLAVSQLMAASGLEDIHFPHWSEARRLEFLTAELASPRPFTLMDTHAGKEARAVMDCYRGLVEHIRKYGQDGIGSLIVSMTHDVSDLLVVYLLAREVGLVFHTPEGLVCPLPVVPLFETIDDLQRSPQILSGFLDHPMTRRSLEYQRQTKKLKDPLQQVMIGYSDSSKDGGVFASQWHLYCAQRELAAVGQAKGVQILFFHGRGGTISRGAGPTHRFIEALPHSSIRGRLRVTEQGEVIAQKYANPLNATYNLGLLLAGTLGMTLIHQKTSQEVHPLEGLMQRMAATSQRIYKALIDSEGFMTFYSQATPIDVIEQSKIGSRPSRRTGQRTLEDLRAIPWVFSWNQARFNLPGWYGVGSALEELSQNDPQAFEELRKHAHSWTLLSYIINSIETSLGTADMEIMQQYAALVEDSALRERIMERIFTEFERTRAMLELVLNGSLSMRNSQFQQTWERRNELLVPLHQWQIAILRKWRASIGGEYPAQAEELLTDLLLTVNAIASGLKTTG